MSVSSCSSEPAYCAEKNCTLALLDFNDSLYFGIDVVFPQLIQESIDFSILL